MGNNGSDPLHLELDLVILKPPKSPSSLTTMTFPMLTSSWEHYLEGIEAFIV